MRLPLYQIDAFTAAVFGGNPAAVCPLESWLPDAVMQSIAAENNLSETAFFVRTGERYALRWFTPAVEIDLCGHATLASAYLITEVLDRDVDRVTFDTRSGALTVSRSGDLLALDFPARPPVPAENVGPLAVALENALGRAPREVLTSRDLMAVYARAEDVAALRPDFAAVAALDVHAVIATAPGDADGVDFVSRFFAPRQGIAEDPVTGSSHCTLIPYWAKRLGKAKLHARQISARGGELFCEDRGARVTIAGRAALYLEGNIHI